MPETPRTRILVADDRDENRYILSRVLEGAGFECLQAGTGASALEMARSQPEIVILDVHLPDVSGYEVCQRLKRDPVTASIPVLQISASFVSSEDRVRALEAGADGYLTHPIDRMVLVATVRALLRLRNAETLARKAADQWKTTFDALAEGLAVVDGKGRLVQWNRAFAELCGATTSITQNESAAEFLERLLGTSQPLHGSAHRYSAEHPIGKRTIQVSVSSVVADHAEEGKILVLTDITDSKLAEYALRTAEKLAATGRLANAIAHEINNPLEGLINLIYLASSSNDLESIQGFLGQANIELARVSRITKQTLAFHRDTQRPIKVDLAALLAEVVALHERSAARRDVRLFFNPPPVLELQGFPGQLIQVFSNLIRNAAEAARPETTVVIRLKSVVRRDRLGARVTVFDRGSGIPESVQSKMFDPFFTTKDLKGSGLGLWVSKSLVSKHEGTIRFRSSRRSQSSGTVFEVFLPLAGVKVDEEGMNVRPVSAPSAVVH
ncbi:MAG TPA: ATP-binding protein [Terracidiphilus sp.]|jgi:two-component system NtrC family sensor kinase|nr:ATP-binding protein [Terracidiphilus sp.]